jgi:hypothetical protein
MDDRSAQVATICECIDHCFAYAIWCEDFVKFLDPEDMVAGLDRGAELVSDATRLTSFLALRKLDDFLRSTKPKADDLIASDFGINVPSVLGDVGETFLTTAEREKINKEAAHLTERLALDHDTEVDLQEILTRSMPVFTGLVSELRKADTSQEAVHWLDKTDVLIDRLLKQESAIESAG